MASSPHDESDWRATVSAIMAELEHRLEGPSPSILDMGDYSAMTTTLRRINEWEGFALEYREALMQQVKRTRQRLEQGG